MRTAVVTMATSNLRRNGDYWARRMKNMEDALLDQSYAYVENLDEQFRAAEAEIERQLSAWYQRFADNNEISLAEARKLLNSSELAEFRWTVEEYIKHGEENALTGAWMKELENASARVHISRLDALKIQLQQQAELLYSNQLDALDAAARQTYTGSLYHTAYEIQRGLGVGWTMQAINEGAIQKVLSRPWTTDGQTFRDRCWTNKQSLVNSVNTQLTQMIVRGESADRAISAISKQFEVSRSKAGRLVMTESAYFSSAAQKDCFTSLGVERYVLVASFDHDTCELCGALDGKVFKMSEYQVGVTAPPFHPWCRCCTAPYYEDLAGVGERWVRNEDGTTGKVPARTTFEEWEKGHVSEIKLTAGLSGATLNRENVPRKEGSALQTVGRIDRDKYRCITDNITTDEVIITEERIQHIRDRHPGDYERFLGYMPEIIADPDYIIEANKANTAVILKEIEENGEKFKLILRLKVEHDPADYQNSVISFWHIGETTWRKTIKNKKVLYRKA